MTHDAFPAQHESPYSRSAHIISAPTKNSRFLRLRDSNLSRTKRRYPTWSTVCPVISARCSHSFVSRHFAGTAVSLSSDWCSSQLFSSFLAVETIAIFSSERVPVSPGTKPASVPFAGPFWMFLQFVKVLSSFLAADSSGCGRHCANPPPSLH